MARAKSTPAPEVEEFAEGTEATVEEETAVVSMEKTEQTIVKVTDFWARHNVGTRASLIVFMVAYVATVIATYFSEKIPPYVLDTTGWLLFAAFMTVTLGINGVREVGNIIIAVKTGKYRKNDGE